MSEEHEKEMPQIPSGQMLHDEAIPIEDQLRTEFIEREMKDDSQKTIGAKVKKTVELWWHKAGPGEIEERFVDAHARILTQIEDADRKKAFASLEDTWRSAGKKWGIAATIVDFGLSVGCGYLSYASFRNPMEAEKTMSMLLNTLEYSRERNGATQRVMPFRALYEGLIKLFGKEDLGKKNMGFAGGGILGAEAIMLGIGRGSRPGHLITKGIANGTEFIRVGKAKSDNYIDSGKAAEYARILGKGLEKGLDGTAQFIHDNPEVVKQTIRTAGNIAEERNKMRELEKQRIERLAKEAERKKNEELQKIRDELFTHDIDYYRLKHGENVTPSVVPDEKVIEKYNARNNSKGKRK